MDIMRRENIKEKRYKIEEMWECEWLQNFKTDDKIKNHARTRFLLQKAPDYFLVKLKDGSLFGYVQCGLVAPEELKQNFRWIKQISSNFHNHRSWMERYSRPHEKLCNRKREVETSSENADI